MAFTVTAHPSPGKATLVLPSGTGYTQKPDYVWNADPNATWYYLWVDDSTGNRIGQWFTTGEAGCWRGPDIRCVSPDIALAPGSAKWWIQTWNASGYGPWSDGKAFTVPAPVSPAKVTLISPVGTYELNAPTYRWNRVSNSTWYYLWVNDNTGNRIAQWYTEAEAGCSVGGSCSVTPDIALAPGSTKWWIQAWGPGGYGPWSDGKEFLATAIPPGKATLVSPSGALMTNIPNYSWNPDLNSTWYYLWVDDSTGTRIQKWYTAAEAGCAEALRTCVAWPGVYLSQGAAKWWVRTWSPNGYGPWSDGMVFTVPSPVSGSMFDLGTLGGAQSYASNVSADGSVVVGYSNNSARNDRAFRWTQASGMVDLGTLGGASSNAVAVSADGSVVVGSSTNNAGYGRAFRWTQASGMVNLGTLGGPASYASSISADGSVVVGNLTNNAGKHHAFRWTQAGGMIDLSTLGGAESYAYGASADGSVVVGQSTNSAGMPHAFRWTQAGGMVDLGTLSGWYSIAEDVSADGSVVVGYSYDNAGNYRAFRWTQADGMIDLGTFGGTKSRAYSVSADGSVVVGDSINNAGNYRAFRWTQAGGMVDLGTLGGAESYAYVVSADGSVVVGDSTNNAENYRAFRWAQAGGMIDLSTLGGAEINPFEISADGSVVVGNSTNNAGNYHAFRWK
jgi:probable HAF family extracellular repeat protein